MGNRAVVQFKDDDSKGVEVYLHWNGGRDSVLAFIKEMERRKWTRTDYAAARFCAVVSEFFDADGTDEGLSLGVFPAGTMGIDFLDNGLFEVFPTKEGFKVHQRGKRVCLADLDRDEKKQYEGILSELETVRNKRKAVQS